MRGTLMGLATLMAFACGDAAAVGVDACRLQLEAAPAELGSLREAFANETGSALLAWVDVADGAEGLRVLGADGLLRGEALRLESDVAGALEAETLTRVGLDAVTGGWLVVSERRGDLVVRVIDPDGGAELLGVPAAPAWTAFDRRERRGAPSRDASGAILLPIDPLLVPGFQPVLLTSDLDADGPGAVVPPALDRGDDPMVVRRILDATLVAGRHYVLTSVTAFGAEPGSTTSSYERWSVDAGGATRLGEWALGGQPGPTAFLEPTSGAYLSTVVAGAEGSLQRFDPDGAVVAYPDELGTIPGRGNLSGAVVATPRLGEDAGRATLRVLDPDGGRTITAPFPDAPATADVVSLGEGLFRLVGAVGGTLDCR